MVTASSDLGVLLDQYEEDPRNCTKLLRSQSLTDSQGFLRFTQHALLTRPISRSLKYITGVALEIGFIQTLFDLHKSYKDEAITIARKASACDSQLGIKIVTTLTNEEISRLPESDFLSGLEILNSISEGDCFVSSVLKILKHPSPHVRSKAALFIGSRTQNLAWVTNQEGEDDPRVRANVIESLYGIHNESVAPLFYRSVHDPNNRVAGNAVLGLYLLKDTNSIPMIYQMAQHEDVPFRNTAAWLMGRTGDSRFSSALLELMRDSDETVRKQAFKALGQIKQAIKAAAARRILNASVLKVFSTSGEHHLWATVHETTGQAVHEIPGTSFIVKSGSGVVHDYSVQEYNSQAALRIAFLMCLPAQSENETARILGTAIKSCVPLRKAKDKWEIVRISRQTRTSSLQNSPSTGNVYRNRLAILNVDFPAATPDRPLAEPERLAEQSDLNALLLRPPLTIGNDPQNKANLEALKNLLESDMLGGRWHLIVLGASTTSHLITDLLKECTGLSLRLHVIGHTPAWNSSEIQELTHQSGGTHCSIQDVSEYQQSCYTLYSSLLHHYQINWKKEDVGTITLDISCEAGRGTATYSGSSEQIPLAQVAC